MHTMKSCNYFVGKECTTFEIKTVEVHLVTSIQITYGGDGGLCQCAVEMYSSNRNLPMCCSVHDSVCLAFAMI